MILLTGLITRELGGSPFAWSLAELAVAIPGLADLPCVTLSIRSSKTGSFFYRSRLCWMLILSTLAGAIELPCCLRTI
jgi:hypothetical protein